MSNKVREEKRTRMHARFAEKRAALKKAGDNVGLQKLPRNSSPSRTKNRCFSCGRPHGYMSIFGLCRICFREFASKGEIPGVKKSSW